MTEVLGQCCQLTGHAGVSCLAPFMKHIELHPPSTQENPVIKVREVIRDVKSLMQDMAGKIFSLESRLVLRTQGVSRLL